MRPPLATSMVLAGVFAWSAGCSATDKPASMREWVSEKGNARFGARLLVNAPEWVRRGSDFELDVTLMLPENPGATLHVADKMFFVTTHGCRVNSIDGQPARLASDVLSGHPPGPDEWTRDYVPADDDVRLDAAGRFRTTIGVTAAPETALLGVVRSKATNQVARGCNIDIWNGIWARAEPAIEVR